MEIRTETQTAAETAALGSRLAAFLRAGDIISLSGDLGAGKTRFVQGLADGLGVADHIGSPTFALIKEYRGRALPLFHFDVYRLDSVADLANLGFEDYFYGDGITVVEWGDKFKDIFPAAALTLTLTRPDETDTRLLVFDFKDIRWQAVIEAALR